MLMSRSLAFTAGAMLVTGSVVAAQSPSSPAAEETVDTVAPLPVGRLVYTSDRARDGGLNVWMLEVGAPEPRQLTVGDQNDFTPELSPDGSRLAFASDRDNPMALSASDSFLRAYDLYTLDLDTLEVTEVYRSRTFKMRPTWSPDGSLIAFDGEDPDAEQLEETGGLVPQVWLMPSDGSERPEAITDEAGGASSPSWSPDGTRIAYHTVVDGRILVMDVETRQAMPLSDGPGDRGPAWSPDGTRIAFSSDRTGDPEIWSMAADGTDLVQLTHSPGSDSQVTWSPDGTMLAFTSERGGVGQDIHVMSADGSGVINVSGNPRGDDGEHRGSDFSPSWSE
jgi:Tol biopolymer transport system component